MTNHHDASHPDWYDPNEDFEHPRFAFALRVGGIVAGVGSHDWSQIERIIGGLWLSLPGGVAWEEARPAVYHSWLMAKRLPAPD